MANIHHEIDKKNIYTNNTHETLQFIIPYHTFIILINVLSDRYIYIITNY